MLRTGPGWSVPDFDRGVRQGGTARILLAKSDISRKLTVSAMFPCLVTMEKQFSFVEMIDDEKV